MPNYYDKAEMFAWMPLTGFDKDAPDKGVETLLKRVGYDLHGVNLFVFHPDIVHHHEGMENVRVLPPDNCSYYANPYNEERCRQEWTNHDLRDLVSILRERGVECFVSIMGITLNNEFHDEWVYDHPELMCVFEGGPRSLIVLKRFKDGTYYEDFFIDKLCEVMLDYGFTGLHVSDAFCPQCICLVDGDYSYDMVDQFVNKTGTEVPQELLIEDDSTESIRIRKSWIWANCRAEWIEFYSARWEQFFKKLCDRLHAIGKKVFVLGMYCTDPFVSLYLTGVDLRKISNAGVDYLMPNQHANTSHIARFRPWRYYEWANMMCLTDAFAPNSRKLNMLSVKDAAEQWDMLHHAPMLLDRDITFLPSYVRYTKDGRKRCLDGYNICLADGIYEEEWKWLNERFNVAFDEVPEKMLTPTLVWSDNAFDDTLRPYIETRRWTLHKFIYEVNKVGAHCGTIVRIEDISDKCGDLFVPNFDLLSDDEKKQITRYTGGAVIATALSENFNKDDYNCTLYFEDENSPLPVCVFVLNMEIANREEILSLANEDDGERGIITDVNAVEEVTYSLDHFMPYQKVSSGIIKALAKLLKLPFEHIIEATHPIIPCVMRDGRIRLYAMNDDLDHYGYANVTVYPEIEKVENVSKFPLLPVKFSDEKDFSFKATDYPNGNHTFELLIAQGGVSIVDIYLK